MNHRGHTLLQWVIALALNAFVLLVLTHSLTGAQKHFSGIDAMADLIERGRFAQALLADSLAQANPRLACARSAEAMSQWSYEVSAAFGPESNAPVQGWEAVGTHQGRWRLEPDTAPIGHDRNTWPQALRLRVDAQSDLIMMHQYRPWAHGPVVELFSHQLELARAHGLKRCAHVLITDCETDWMFQNISEQPRTLAWSASGCGQSNHMGPEAPVWPNLDRLAVYEWLRIAWFVGSSTTGQRTLYRAIFDRGDDRPRIEAMVEGVETLQVEYAVGPDAPIWSSADQISDWTGVVGVRFAVVVRADRPIPIQHSSQTQDWPILSGEVSWPLASGEVRVFGSGIAFPSLRRH